MQNHQSKKSKAALIIMTILVVIGAIGFFYPFLTKSPTYIPRKATTTSDTTGPHLPTAERTVDGVPLLTKFTDLFKSGLPVYYGITTDDLMNEEKFPSGEALNTAIMNVGEKSNETSRIIGTKSFTAPGIGYYVYFAWPTAYEDGGVFSCKSITLFGDPKGTVDCFNSGTSESVLFNTTDMIHRSVSDFPDSGGGGPKSYELYRAHFFISSGGTVFYQPH